MDMEISPIDVGSIVGISSLILTVAKLYFEQRKTKKELELSKQYLQNLTQILRGQQDLDKQKLEWQKLTDIGRALWKLSQPIEEEEYDY